MSVLFLAPLVVMQRLPQLWFEALHPNPMVSEESRLAVSEKLEAVAEGLFASQMAAMAAPMNAALSVMRGRSPVMAAMAMPQAVVKAATAPIEKRVRLNLRRLSKPIGQRSRSTKR